MKTLIVGLGSIGLRHANNLYRLGITDLSFLRKRNLDPPGELLCKNGPVITDYDEALEQGPDAVVIANPTAMHIEYATKAMEAGCNIYMEKPLSHTTDGLGAITKLAVKRGLVFAVGCQFRFHPNLEKIKEWIDASALGKVFSVYVDMGEYLPGFHPWEDYRESYASKQNMGGGVILTLIHELDYIYWLFGSVRDVYAMGGQLTPLEIDVEDTAMISMITKQGIPVQVRMDYWRKPPVRKMHIVGENGEIIWDYYKGEATLTNEGVVKETSSVPHGWERNDMFLSTMKDFLRSIEEGTIPRTPLYDGLEVLKIAIAAQDSIKTNKVIAV